MSYFNKTEAQLITLYSHSDILSQIVSIYIYSELVKYCLKKRCIVNAIY
jgi:hypothetical protein